MLKNQCLIKCPYPELGQDIPALDIFSSETDLPVSVVLIALEISKRHLENSVFQTL